MAFPIPDQERLQGYLEADPKHEAAPIPVPVDRALAVRAITERVKPDLPPRELQKLVRLAVFYDLRETAPAFGSILKQGESKGEDFARSAQALIALAWIGDAPQWDYALRYYRALQERADPERDHDAMLAVCDALGPREGTDAHRQWVSVRLAKVERELAEAQQKKTPQENWLENRRNELREYLAFTVRDVDRDNAGRLRIAGMPPEARPHYLAPLYMRDPDLPGISQNLSYWSAMTLIRLAVAGLRAPVGAEFARLAAKYGQAGDPQPQTGMLRARALRAMEFFGQQLDEPTKKWLAGQADSGVDLLAMRPNWKYTPAQEAAEAP